jgi:hypothetical protein
MLNVNSAEVATYFQVQQVHNVPIKSLVTSQHNYSTISIARTVFLQVLTLSALKAIFITFNITNPNPNYGTWYIVHTPQVQAHKKTAKI